MSELDLTHFEKAIADIAAHEHPKYEDIFCLNLICWLGERAGLLVTEIKRLRAELAEAKQDIHAQHQAAQDAKQLLAVSRPPTADQPDVTVVGGDIVLCRVAVVDLADTARRQHSSADRPPLAYSRPLPEHDFRFRLATASRSHITFQAEATAAYVASWLSAGNSE